MSVEKSKQKIESIKQEIDSYNDIEKLKSFALAKADEYKEAALSEVKSKAGLIIAALPQGAGAVATAASLQVKAAASAILSIAEKATILTLLAQKIQQLTKEQEEYASKKAQQLRDLENEV
ncbi:hypothetical protein M0P65_06480 [Candidatus Gracilibacteria bacterium]|jgi:hypothetical protein|nr:hypothetical protein [Candidatus Gracilibacteria bacterium]